MPHGGYLVNTSRGGVLDEGAILDALRTNQLAGAALDVLPGEQELAQGRSRSIIEYARDHDNLLITPHIGGATKESMAKTEVFMARKLQRFLKQERWGLYAY